MAAKKGNGYGWIQPLRLVVQLAFCAAVVCASFNTKIVSEWLFYAILLLGVFFCGWVCPLGAAQDWATWLGRKLRLPRLRIPQRVQQYLQLSRYVLYALLTLGIVVAIFKGPYHYSMLLHGVFYTGGAIFIICMIVLGLFTDRPFCNYLCTGGARMGLFSVLRIFGIKRNTNTCGGCGLCTRKCPMNIDVAHTDFVRHPNCIGCLQCVSTCPKKCLRYALMPSPQHKK
ncbi:MAG: 4Fe-4S binding protein [Akkermansiaceae bacterium]|nr:4Fe-4S binding protein [Akkermansiaceae bacterium]